MLNLQLADTVRPTKLKFWQRSERRPGEAKVKFDAKHSAAVRAQCSDLTFNEAWASVVAAA